MRRGIERIEAELQERLAYFEKEGKLLEAQRLRMRTQYDLEMMQEVGFCSGIENYSAPDRRPRPRARRPHTLLDFFPKDFLVVLDESHQTVPQLHGQYEGDRSRKEQLIEHGFRLPSAADNRPLRFEEFIERVGQVVFLSATPGPFELEHVDAGGRAGRAAHRPGRPRGHRQAHQGPDRRPHGADQRPGQPGRPGARHHAHQEDVRGPHRLPARARRAGALPPQRGRHDPAHRDPARPPPRRVRRARRHQPAAGGPRPARGVAGGDPRRRQGGLPPQRDVAHPDDRPGRPQRRRPGDHVRRPGHALDAAGHLRDQPPAQAAESSTTSSTASTRRPSARPSPTSSPTSGRPRPRRCRARTGARTGPIDEARRAELPSCRARSWAGSSAPSTEEMHEASADLRFEYAARLRDEIKELKRELREVG